MEEIAKTMTVEEAVEQVIECKLEVWKEIESINEKLVDGENRMTDIEDILIKHENQRNQNAKELKESFNALKAELMSYRNDFNNHDRVEMEKYDDIIKGIKELSQQISKTKKETDHNTKILEEKAEQDKIDTAIVDAIAEKEKPYKELRSKVIVGVLVGFTTAISVGLYNLIVFVIELNSLIRG